MPRPFIAGNWKMNMLLRDAEILVMELHEQLNGMDLSVEVAIAPPFTALRHLSHLISNSPIKLCAQDMFWEKEGAYTGEISPLMLIDVGCQYVIVGHSERRQYLCESDEIVNKKVISAVKHGLRPIMCVGESIYDRENGNTLSIIKKQVEKGLAGVLKDEIKDVVVAYEPVWAIGTGKTATPKQAEEVHNFIRNLLCEIFGLNAVKETRILYGGSVKPDNIDTLMAEPNIDGALVGGASLDAKDFARIVRFEKTGGSK
ncbi:MAG: triose-phosphate isomerase [Deltaproteobacteria bacterium]|nr:triose-phosphate isomerase [Deltaproteobacteria bacterium]